MKLPFFKKKQDDTGFYLALLLTDEKAGAVILHEENGKVKIIGNHEEHFSTELDHVHLEELIEVVDKALSRAEESLPPSIETHKTVFGVKESWVEEDSKKIKKHHLTQLKKVCDSLDLTPIGFMVTTEAITHLIQEEEGAPLSAIMADISKTGVTLTLLRGGKKIESVNGPFKEFTPPMTVDMLLRHFTVPVLPARLILSDSDSSEKLAQQFISHQWSKSLPFLHVPQITVLPPGFDAKAVAFGAAAQMGYELIGIEKEHPKNLTPVVPMPVAAAHPHASQHDEKKEEAELEEPATEELPEKTYTADNFGFVTDQDIADMAVPAEKESVHAAHGAHHEALAHESVHPASHHRDDNEIHAAHNAIQLQKHDDVDDEDEYDGDEDEEEEDQEIRGRKAGPLAFLSGIKLPKLGGKKGLDFAALGKNKKIVLPLLILGGILSAIIGLFIFYTYNVEATVELTMKPNMVNQTAKTVFSTGSGSDYSKNIIAAKNLSATVDGEAAIDATGKKDVGEKAKGTVTIFNNSGEKVTLKSGTEIKSSNNHTFILEKDVTVASASGDIFSGTKPGTADVAAVAKDIGSEQNVPSNTKFTISGNSSLAAKNDSAFSGGTKKSVTVVSRDDHAKLRAELPKSLERKAKSAIEQKASDNETVLPYFATNSLENASYDKKIDEEAKRVKLKASVVFDGMAYDNSELVEYAKTLIKKDQSEDINLADNSIRVTVKEAKQNDDKEVEATVVIEGGVLPKIDTTEVAKGLEGKSLNEANDTLAGLPQIDSTQISFSPGIPLLPQLFPSLPKKIKVVLTTQ